MGEKRIFFNGFLAKTVLNMSPQNTKRCKNTTFRVYVFQIFSLCSNKVQTKTTVAREEKSCRNSAVLSSAARSRQNTTDRAEEGLDTLKL